MIENVLHFARGRRIGYAEWGEPDAPAVIYCHGFPGCRRELRLAQAVVERTGIRARVVALDRPGYGASTFQPGRRIVDWPSDVAQAADQLGIESFAVLGASGGSPYALACGRFLRDRVTRIGIVVGIGPLHATGMGESPSVTGLSSNWIIRRLQFGALANGLKRGRDERFVERATAGMSEPDQAVMELTHVRGWFIDTAREALAQGGRGASHEAGLNRAPWGFELGDIAVETLLWYGGADRNVPASVGRWLAARLPKANLEVWPEHGHFTWAVSDEAADVVAATVGAGRPHRLT